MSHQPVVDTTEVEGKKPATPPRNVAVNSEKPFSLSYLYLSYTGNGKIDFIEFVNLMEKMTKPHEENASTMEAFRVFDAEGSGVIDSKIMRDVIMKSLDQVSLKEIQDMLDYSGLLQDRPITYEGM